jgi:hypothetical protein
LEEGLRPELELELEKMIFGMEQQSPEAAALWGKASRPDHAAPAASDSDPYKSNFLGLSPSSHLQFLYSYQKTSIFSVRVVPQDVEAPRGATRGEYTSHDR